MIVLRFNNAFRARHGFTVNRSLTDNSDGDDEPSGPPKKKRRRQALSCTGKKLPLQSVQETDLYRVTTESSTSHPGLECKRRKIKCDRWGDCS